ncbi:MAG: DUF342 domain-containing protein [Bdellovibrionales bacterium]|nr:DUF342 domain-containing protein [Bdellovibrionales bacterium]
MSERSSNAGMVLELQGDGPAVAERGLTIEGEVSDDGLKLFLTCHRDLTRDTPPLSYDELKGLLVEHVPAEFIHDSVLQEIVDLVNRDGVAPKRRVAKGTPAVPGRDGKLLLLVKPYRRRSGEREQVDARYVRYFDNIETGSPVARLYAPTNGQPGIDVLGEEMKAASGKPAEVKFDDSLQLVTAASRGYDTLVATVSGYLDTEGPSLRVHNELVLTEDIDFRIGDIDFIGAVRLRGSLMKGFRIKARGNIVIEGNVVGGKLVSTEGSIEVKGTVTGDGGAAARIDESSTLRFSQLRAGAEEDQIAAARSVALHVVEGVTVSAGETIRVQREAHHARFRTRGVLDMTGAKFISGAAYAVCGIQADAIGSPAEEETVALHLCSDVESSAEYLDLTEAINRHLHAEATIRVVLGPFADDPAAVRRLEPEYRRKMVDLHAKLTKVSDSRQRLEEERTTLLATAKYNSVMCVNFNKKIFRGVRIIAGEQHYLVEDTATGPGCIEFVPAEQGFVTGPTKALVCDLAGTPKVER